MIKIQTPGLQAALDDINALNRAEEIELLRQIKLIEHHFRRTKTAKI